MSWDGAILTDSGGYQVFSHRELREHQRKKAFNSGRISTAAKIFSPRKKSSIFSGPWVRISPWSLTIARPIPRAMRMRKLPWSCRCAGRNDAASNGDRHDDEGRALFGIVQGSVYPDLQETLGGSACRTGFFRHGDWAD